MNTNMNELNLNEMEQVNGGICGIAIAACTVAAITAGVKLAEFVYDCATGRA